MKYQARKGVVIAYPINLQKKEDLFRNFIKQLKGRESHYNRQKSKSANLSIRRLPKMYNQQNLPKNWVSLSMFSNIFVSEFNIGFSSAASDVCRKCTTLKEQYKMENNTERKKQLLVEYRLRKKSASAFYELAKESPEGSLTFCFDLQQVQHTSRGSFYAFCCVGISS